MKEPLEAPGRARDTHAHTKARGLADKTRRGWGAGGVQTTSFSTLTCHTANEYHPIPKQCFFFFFGFFGFFRGGGGGGGRDASDDMPGHALDG